MRQLLHEEVTLTTEDGATLRRRPQLVWSDGGGMRSVLLENRSVVGAAPEADVVVVDPTVSRLHAEFDPRDDGVWVRDLGSRNGTFVDGLLVQCVRLRAGSHVRLGQTEIRVDYEDAPEQAVPLWHQNHFGKLVGSSIIMRELFALLARLAPSDSSVLISGETGTGKELVARAIHEASNRANQPFVVVDCAAVPENLMDAELFGHSKGAFTGALSARVGAIEAADGGTVFLDEIGELPISMQPKLLRVLESRTIRRVGETQYRPVNVRFLSATHRDLLTMVTAASFREDLYFRLSVLPVHVPALRDRGEDIRQLAIHFAGDVALLSNELFEQMESRKWRGNVRELRNFIDRVRAIGTRGALAMMTEQTSSSILPRTDAYPAVPDLEDEYVVREPVTSLIPAAKLEQMWSGTLRTFRDEWRESGDREYVKRLLAIHERNVAEVAREADVDRTYIYRLIRKYDL